MASVKLPPLREQAADILRREIYSGRLANGQELTQEEAAAALGISRIPVREAFLILESEGLLCRLPNRHVRVQGVTSASLHQNFQILAALESQMALLALESGLPSLDALSDEELHSSFAAALKNPGLQQLYVTQRRGSFSSILEALPPMPTRDALNAALRQALASASSDAVRHAIYDYYHAMAAFAAKELKL